jgi:Family of unknown function (DUF6526)
MAENVPQTYANHTRTHPPFHFFVLPGGLLLLILTIVNVVRHSDLLTSWILLLIGVMWPIAMFLIRINPLRAQDRLIRLEEQLRAEELLSDELLARSRELTASQWVALRFASDAEFPGLVEKALNGKLKGAEIKKAIVVWRPDTFRV